MMTAFLDLIGMYNYDPSVLDGLVYPAGLDPETLKDNILMESAEQELIYSNIEFMKQAISSWSFKQLHVWQELYDTTQYEYNPIWNKDGTFEETITRDLKATEDYTDTHNLQDKNTRNYEDKETRNYEDKETRDLKGSNDVTVTESVYGFNSSTEAPANKSVTDQDTTDTGTDTINHTGTDTMNHTGTDTINHTGTFKKDRDTTDTGTIKTTRTEKGNIGVTSTQSMIKEQREVVMLNLYDVITQDFIERFCLKVY